MHYNDHNYGLVREKQGLHAFSDTNISRFKVVDKSNHDVSLLSQRVSTKLECVTNSEIKDYFPVNYARLRFKLHSASKLQYKLQRFHSSTAHYQQLPLRVQRD